MEAKPSVRWGRFALGALIVAWLFDFLFWKKPQGISLLLFIVIAVAVGLYPADPVRGSPGAQ